MSQPDFFNAWIGLGGNLGKVKDAMSYALQRFECHPRCRVIAVSSLYKTPPWGKTDQPWFLNACAKLSTTLEPEALLRLCLDMEKTMQRKRIEKWGPRTLDIDLLVYEDRKFVDSEHLVLPHPRIRERAFVLVPLAQISPELLLEGRSVAEMAKKFDEEGIIKLSIEKLWWKTKLSRKKKTAKAANT